MSAAPSARHGDISLLSPVKLGAPPAMIPLDLTLLVPGRFFQRCCQGEETPLRTHQSSEVHTALVAITTFNGLTRIRSTARDHLASFREIRLQGHAPVQIETLSLRAILFLPMASHRRHDAKCFYAPFRQYFRTAKVDRIALRVESVPGRKSFIIESAWLEKGEAAPARLFASAAVTSVSGAARVEETTVRVPESGARTMAPHPCQRRRSAESGFARLRFCRSRQRADSLDQLIALLNRERRNDRLYVGLFVPAPTLLWDDMDARSVIKRWSDGRPSECSRAGESVATTT